VDGLPAFNGKVEGSRPSRCTKLFIMENLTVLFLHTQHRAQSHQFIVGDDGLVDYHSNRIIPRECFDRFLIDYPMFNVIRAEVCQRISTPDGPKEYIWVNIERYKGG
jgi:hypothetical protein